jgi:two-component system, NarL family, response regulator NreC
MATDLIRVLLADDHSVVRAGLKAVLNGAKDIDVVGEASTGREAVAATDRLKPDVVVMDLSMPEMDGAAATRAILSGGGETRVLALTMHAEEEYVDEVMQAGASAYLVKSEADRNLVSAIRAVAHGDVKLHPIHHEKAHSQETPQQRYDRLTNRERDVLRLVGQGFSAPEIGGKLGISSKTVDTYKQRIQEKLDLSHRSHYVQFALQLGLLNRG